MTSEWVVTTTPDDPSLNPLWLGEARDALDAFDQYAKQEGYPTYTELIDPRESPLHEDERLGLICQTSDGQPWAIMTNYSVTAVPVVARSRPFTGRLTPAVAELIEQHWWKLMQGTLELDHDPALSEIIDRILKYAPDQIFDRNGHLVVDQFDRDGNELDTVTDDEMARRIVSALATILYGG